MQYAESMERSDADLLEAVRRGDRSAMEDILERHERQIYRFGLRMCGDEDDAREVLQETLVAAFRNLPSFRGEAALSTWLYQIARSFCIKERPAHRGPWRLRMSRSREAMPVPTRAATPARSERRSRRRSARCPRTTGRRRPARRRGAERRGDLARRRYRGRARSRAGCIAPGSSSDPPRGSAGRRQRRRRARAVSRARAEPSAPMRRRRSTRRPASRSRSISVGARAVRVRARRCGAPSRSAGASPATRYHRRFAPPSVTPSSRSPPPAESREPSGGFLALRSRRSTDEQASARK